MALGTIHRPAAAERTTREEIAAVVAGLGDLLPVVRHADLADKSEVYRQLGLRLTYHPDTQIVRAEARLNPHDFGVIDRVRGGT